MNITVELSPCATIQAIGLVHPILGFSANRSPCVVGAEDLGGDKAIDLIDQMLVEQAPEDLRSPFHQQIG